MTEAVKSAARMLALLDMLATCGPSTFTEVVARLRIPKSSAHALLHTAQAAGWVTPPAERRIRWALNRTISTDVRALAAHGAGAILLEVLAERTRQVAHKGYTPEHDREHRNGELASAAACYAVAQLEGSSGVKIRADRAIATLWPWDDGAFRPKQRRRNLIIALALLVAEVERLDTAEKAPEGTPAC